MTGRAHPAELRVLERFEEVRDDEARTLTAPSRSKRLAELVDDQFEVTQDNVAAVFAQQFADTLRFSHDRGRWYEWNGSRWQEELTEKAFDYTRQLTRALNTEGKREFAKASFCEGVEKFARADRAFAMAGTEWDADPMLLNTPDGTVDLDTGEMRPQKQADLITKTTSVGPKNGEPPVWLEFLRQATEGDDELILFLRRVAGHCLTGDTREECLFFLYGTGGNGKGTFVSALYNIMSGYAVNAPMEVFLASRHERHSTELAMLRGARVVTASETTEGRAWDEQRIKAMTGNDPITARFMRQNNFTFMPQFKLLLLGNNKPVLRTVDEAWRRRFHIVPFTFTPPRRDETLKERLRAEYPQILAWAIQGCLEWQSCGLQPPERVLRETAGYFEAQDTFATWLEDCCTTGQQYVASNNELFRSWVSYCERHNENAGTNRSFGDRLAARNFRRFKNEFGLRGRGFQGLKVNELSHLEGV